MARRQSYNINDIDNPVRLIGGAYDGVFIEDISTDIIRIPVIGFDRNSLNYQKSNNGDYYLKDDKERE